MLQLHPLASLGVLSRVGAAVLLLATPCIAHADDAGLRPNIIVYMVDDLGWNHISSDAATMRTHSDVYSTPHIERLARNGLSFTSAYAQPNCAPTRAAMLSGQYPARTNNDVYVVGNLNRYSKGKGRGNNKDLLTKANARFRGPEQSEDVAPAAVTIAEALEKNGYATAHIGKYHVGGHRGDATLPENVGFDRNLGGFKQGHQPTCFAKENKSGGFEFSGVGRGDFDRWATPYSRDYVAKRGLPESLVGTPKHLSCALGDAMEQTVGELAADDEPFYLQFFSYAVHGPVRARPDLKQAAKERLGANASGTSSDYIGFIAGMDENLGRILAAVEDPNGDGNPEDSIAENTLILFTSDNGGTHASNEPLRGTKGMLTEGGIRVPLIAAWKNVIPAGTVTNTVVHTIDYYPTCLELAGGKWMPPASEHPLDGFSFASVLMQPDSPRVREPIFYLFPGYMDTRAQPSVVVIDQVDGARYKLTYFYESDDWELYNLTADLGETKNLIDRQRGIAATLSQKIRDWLTQSDATWTPKFPLDANSMQPVGPPPVFAEAEVRDQ